MKIGLIGGLLLVPAGMYGQTKMESPNIVIIEADDLGFGGSELLWCDCHSDIRNGSSGQRGIALY